jgi:hypothetical protein
VNSVANHKPHWTELPPVWRWLIGTAIQTGDVALRLGCIALVGASTWVMVDADVNQRFTIRRGQAATAETSGGYRIPNAHNIIPINVGDTVAGYRVTSGYGARQAPCPGCSSYHPGIDLATPTGTPLYAPGDVEVSCKSETAGGHYAEFEYQGMTHQWLHLAPGSCQPGPVTKGQKFAATGASGRGTGAHLDYRVKQGGQRVFPPIEVLTFALDPSSFKASSNAPSAGTPGAPIPDDLLKRAIGRAEGTRDASGQPTQAYYGHKDPGWSGRCQNQGSFSYQHCAASPEVADQSWVGTLRKAEQDIQAQAQAKFGQPLSQAAMVAALDGYTQSPNAGGMFVDYLPTADPTPQQIIAARTAALYASRRAKGGPPMNVPRDQQRRVNALLEQLSR